jgi:hypothetical protein
LLNIQAAAESMSVAISASGHRQQLGLVWDLLLKADPEGPALIFRAAYPDGQLFIANSRPCVSAAHPASTSLPLTIALQIPTYVDDRASLRRVPDGRRPARGDLAVRYSIQIQDQYRDQFQSLPADSDDKNIGDPPF